MSDLYEEYGLEMEEEPSVGATPSTDKKEPVIKKSGGWGRSIIALVLGIVIGVGAVVGGGYYAVSSPARDAIELIGGFAGINYEEQVQNKFLSEEYEDKTILEIGKEIAKVVKDKNLVGLNNIVPALGEYLEKLVGNMKTEFGVSMDADELLSTPFHELPAYLGETFRVTPLGSMLKATSKVDALDPILMEICYGEEGVQYYIDENGDVVMNEGYQAATFETLGSNPNGMINNVSLAAVLPPDANDALMLSMAYGKENVTFTMEKDASGNPVLDEKGKPIITMLPMFFEKEGDDFYDYNGDIVSCETTTLENGFIQMVKAPTYNGAGAQTYYLKETDGKYYAYTAPTEDAEQVNFKKTMIGDLSANSSALINNVYLKDALNIEYDPVHPENDPHPILFSLAYGVEGLDYTVDPTTKAITMIADAQPRTIGDLRERGTDLINDIAIADIMSADKNDALGMYLLYGKKDIHYTFDGEGNIVMLQQYIAIADDNSKVYNEYGERLVEANGETAGYTLNSTEFTFTDIHGVEYKYTPASPEKTIKTNDGQMKVYYLSYKDDQPAMFTRHSLAELAGGNNLISRLTDRLSLSEVLHDSNLSENKFLKHVSDCSVNEIPDKLLELSIVDMFSDEIYGVGAIKHEGDIPLTYINGETIVEIVKGEYYFNGAGGYEKAELQGTWWYLLHNDTIKPHEYLIAGDDTNGMNALLSNMTNNVENAKLSKLHSDGIIAGLGSLVNNPLKTTILGTPIPDIPADATTMGDLTVTQMLDYTSKVLSLIP